MDDLLLEARGVQKAFGGVKALEDGRLQLRRGSVHALCGGNGAGKSTFLGVVMGITQRDAGDILLKGRSVAFQSPADALANRIAIITQELSPIPGMTVAENLYLGREPSRAGVFVRFAELARRAQALLDRLGFPVDARATMSSLSLAQIQLVEIAKAFSHDCDVMIMDEPTSAIGERETEVLFSAIRNLTAQGAGIIYVSHRLSEIFQIADDYTVFRDGKYVESGRIADIDRAHLVSAIVGRKLSTTEKVRRPVGQPVLESSGLTRGPEFADISLTVHQGEVLGIYGLMGAGRSEYLNCVYGLTRPDSGEVRLNGRKLPIGQPRKAIQAGLALVTEDRKETGLVLSASVRDNIAFSAYKRLSTLSVISRRRVTALVESMVERMKIKTSSVSLPVSSMSGGNQQKVVLARCLSTGPSCLLCDEPTRGIDEGAKREVYRLLDEFVTNGGAAIVVSSEAQEILDVSDRIAIFKSGQLVKVIDGHTTTQEDLLHLAS
ncbi:TPA: sugar ABC transporter ATP-binding protein [Burkholderia aenigmatica]|uniref:sugar ABC transporter ATP-binding protein n=1 Tax=Burkholderia sp. AU45251 TaxID=3059204 RepID=UPI00264B3E97|nr:sugar ABC transporter ATP-binding protein [Burkholderia sp. AU45251]HDR9488251.1 sugar ABC transporter ATP-binding protein [Burkholderia aenigmatica]MDN7521115.1 sugar ABC transporter ATP-binding protein [Burkholderia sp. AU45251]HDR9520069.1 sugar ABC transporter ATP-binding protein [Burkholderia aenigmatica]HDR9597175.1 sugar ABC transporter ATP-binding protein [Burkholderia aenigmatica]HDR9605068.1 sugar ABC transporter ATP-binding protein [Burkholderia aenigmatica]